MSGRGFRARSEPDHRQLRSGASACCNSSPGRTMTLIGLILIIAAAALCHACKWPKLSRTLYALSLTLFLAIGCGVIPAWLLRELQSAYTATPPFAWGKHNVIVLLGAGTEKVADSGTIEPGFFSYGHIVEAAARYHDCKNLAGDCKIIVSGGDAMHHGVSEAVVYRESLLRLGIDAADVLCEPNSMNTWQNAQFTSVLLQQNRADRVLLVTSAVHLRRSTWYFAQFGVNAIPVHADWMNATLSAVPLADNFSLNDRALHEYGGLVSHYVFQVLGWNTAAIRPGKM